MLDKILPTNYTRGDESSVFPCYKPTMSLTFVFNQSYGVLDFQVTSDNDSKIRILIDYWQLLLADFVSIMTVSGTTVCHFTPI